MSGGGDASRLYLFVDGAVCEDVEAIVHADATVPSVIEMFDPTLLLTATMNASQVLVLLVAAIPRGWDAKVDHASARCDGAEGTKHPARRHPAARHGRPARRFGPCVLDEKWVCASGRRGVVVGCRGREMAIPGGGSRFVASDDRERRSGVACRRCQAISAATLRVQDASVAKRNDGPTPRRDDPTAAERSPLVEESRHADAGHARTWVSCLSEGHVFFGNGCSQRGCSECSERPSVQHVVDVARRGAPCGRGSLPRWLLSA